MKALSAQQIRNLYKQFFAEHGHQVFPSASLVPQGDASLLWINAGMAPLKPYFDGREIPENPRIVSSQKCIRTNDIENVGYTARHQTFFEMLGNFSFGDYFKKEAIEWAWEFLTKWMEIDPERLSATIHTDDDEAFEIWHQHIGLPKERIVRLEDNFWEIGVGPCGPDSEIFFDRGADVGCGQPTCQPGCDCDRFLEIWNLVFTQYNKDESGEYSPLPKKNIDTGMGLERMASVLQDVSNNFETDLFQPIIAETARIAGVEYASNPSFHPHFKIIADHVRTVCFAIGDGVLPGNEGRSYIIRRLLRRAVRSGRKLGVEKPFLFRLAAVVADIMGDDYSEVRDKLEFIERVIRLEEERFHETLSEGEALLSATIEQLQQAGEDTLSGEDAFRLYDTFGFPIDLTEEMCREHGVKVNHAGFEAELQVQRDRARAARQTSEGMNAERGALETLTETSTFVGYDQFVVNSEIVALLKGGERVEALQAGDEGQVILAVTPFYAESGGQIADKGSIASASGAADVVEVQKAPHGQHVHTVSVTSGKLTVGDKVTASVDEALRRDTVKNHTATHLLHKALREVLGDHVAQAGSLVEPERLRFDFSHFGPMSPEEIRDVEDRVNRAIWLDMPVATREMDLDEAKKIGAMALFGEKYGHRVRVVSAGDYSTELCGGCHVERTGIIGLFQIVSETGIGAGTRRIEAVTGRFAYRHTQHLQDVLQEASQLLKTTPAELTARAARVLEEVRHLERELESARAKLNHVRAGELQERVVLAGDVPVLAAVVPDTDMDGLRQLVDDLRAKMPTHVIVLGSAAGGKPQFVAAVSKDLHGRKLHAGQIVKQVAQIAGGGGGGRPDLAQAGGKEPEKLLEAIESVLSIIESFAGNVRA